MPELPEVQTTVNGLNRYVRGLVIKDVWTDYYSEFHIGKPNIKNRKYFKKFRTVIIGAKILGASRRAKNILIGLSNDQTILVHMKLTGCLLYGTYNQPLTTDNKEKFIHVIFSLSNGKELALSDLRKFAKITLLDTNKIDIEPDLKNLGPEPLEKNFTWQKFRERLLKKPNGTIIVLSNLGQDTFIAEGVALGARGYMIKSDYTPDQIIAEVKHYLAQTTN